jgi:hypothetical protein
VNVSRQPNDEAMTHSTRDVLDFELGLPGRRPTRSDVRARFGWSLTTYYAILWRAIDMPDVIAAEPMLVSRLRRIRDELTETRSTLVA